MKPTYLSGSANKGAIDTESELLRQLSKLRGRKSRGERERYVHALKEHRETGTLGFMRCVKCSVLNYVYVMLFVKSYSKNFFQAF